MIVAERGERKGGASVAASPAELDALARWRGGQTAGSAMRMLVTGLGYAVALLGTLSMMSISVGHLLLGGAIAGVVIGIAAQQSLGNVFAGMVLLMARPFRRREPDPYSIRRARR